MPSLLQGIQGFAGASGVGIMCLTALFLGASVFATNLPALADFVAVSTTWSGIVTIPILVVAYVVGVLAIAVVEGVTSAGIVELDALQGLAAQRFSQLEQEAEILSGSVIGFLLLAAAAFLNVWAYPGWARTLMICGAAASVTAVGAWKVSRAKHQSATTLARKATSQVRREVDRDAV
jgi:hypothetical protein